ncbi:voltage dependent calcium channel L-type [Apostichopus japonicus]|uniref:Voltage dependent calcium channel L-type n=1 Tax=Stichopus japonicus TaxID=307972 RepID=A0A2G8JUA0_STIJA|nr:voltage dependent calcium channel L-type [Apostichopus japonicus]
MHELINESISHSLKKSFTVWYGIEHLSQQTTVCSTSKRHSILPTEVSHTSIPITEYHRFTQQPPQAFTSKLSQQLSTYPKKRGNPRNALQVSSPHSPGFSPVNSVHAPLLQRTPNSHGMGHRGDMNHQHQSLLERVEDLSPRSLSPIDGLEEDISSGGEYHPEPYVDPYREPYRDYSR